MKVLRWCQVFTHSGAKEDWNRLLYTTHIILLYLSSSFNQLFSSLLTVSSHHRSIERGGNREELVPRCFYDLRCWHMVDWLPWFSFYSIPFWFKFIFTTPHIDAAPVPGITLSLWVHCSIRDESHGGKEACHGGMSNKSPKVFFHHFNISL